MQTIRFYGTETSLLKWSQVVTQTTGRKCGEIKTKKDRFGGRLCFEVKMTQADRVTLQRQLWNAESGTGTNALGTPYKWNDCIAYEVLK